MLRIPFLRGRRPRRTLATSFRLLEPRPFASLDTEGYAARYQGGAYLLELKRPSYFAWEHVRGFDGVADLVAEVVVEFDPRTLDAAAGLLFRSSDDTNYYALLASTRGTWRLDRVLNNHPLPLVPWSPLPEASGPSRHLRVVASGTRITVVADEEWVGEVEDDSLDAGGVCLAAQSHGASSGAVVRFRHFKLEARPLAVQRQHLRYTYWFPAQPSARLALAEAFASQGAWGPAAVQLTKGLRKREGTPRERVLLAETFLRLGDPDRALGELERVLAAQPAHPEARLAKGEALYLANRFIEARDWLVAVLPDLPPAPGSWNLLGNCEYALGNWRRAADAYLRAVELAPDAPLVVKNAARALELAGDRDGALARYLQAARLMWSQGAHAEIALVEGRIRALDPDNREVRGLAARVLFEEGRRHEARQLLEQLEAEGAEDSAVPFLLGTLAAEDGERERAVPLLERAAALEPGFALYHLRLAETLHLLGRDAAGPLARARELAPDDPWVANLEGQIRLAAADAAGAVERFRAATAAAPAETTIRINLSEALARSGDLAAALAELDVPSEGASAQDAALANQRGNLLAAAGRHAEAVPAYELAIRLDPKAPEYRENCAAACIEADHVSRAEELLARLEEEHPSPRIYNLIGQVASLRNERHRAELAWARGLSLDPGDPDIRANLAAQQLARGGWQRAKELIEEVLRDHPTHGHANRLLHRIRDEHERSLSCVSCGRTWWVPRDLGRQPGLSVRGEPPADAPAGRCTACGSLYCVGCATPHLVEDRFTCAACGGPLRLSDDALRWLLASRLP